MMVSHHVPSRRPDVPARFESLNGDTLGLILKFVGNKSYKSFGGVNKHCREVYIASGMEKKTFIFGYAPLAVIQDRLKNWKMHEWELYETVGKGVIFYNRSDMLEWALQEQKKDVLNDICYVAAEEDRLDILNEVSNKVEDDEDNKQYVFQGVDSNAAHFGKLNVLKWLESKEVYIDKKWCAHEAARGGQLQILQWLQEEQDLELFGRLYSYAIIGDQLHVMKWLREKKVDWTEETFRCAVFKGNLDILQWLHDEGCPWPEDYDYRVYESELKPEALEWLQVNGYRDGILSRR